MEQLARLRRGCRGGANRLRTTVFECRSATRLVRRSGLSSRQLVVGHLTTVALRASIYKEEQRCYIRNVTDLNKAVTDRRLHPRCCYLQSYFSTRHFLVTICTICAFSALCLQCFDAVGWVAGRASGL